jgi:hypothetical protein
MWRAWGVLAAAAVLVGCTPENDTEEAVRGALMQANIREVDVVTDGRTVRLSGQVDTLAERTRAVELAAAIVGTTSEVENDITVTGLGPLEDGGETRPQGSGPPRQGERP